MSALIELKLLDDFDSGISTMTTDPFNENDEANSHGFSMRYAAFIDILGFKEHVDASVENALLYQTISDCLDEMNIVRPEKDQETGLLATNFFRCE